MIASTVALESALIRSGRWGFSSPTNTGMSPPFSVEMIVIESVSHEGVVAAFVGDATLQQGKHQSGGGGNERRDRWIAKSAELFACFRAVFERSVDTLNSDHRRLGQLLAVHFREDSVSRTVGQHF